MLPWRARLLKLHHDIMISAYGSGPLILLDKLATCGVARRAQDSTKAADLKALRGSAVGWLHARVPIAWRAVLGTGLLALPKAPGQVRA